MTKGISLSIVIKQFDDKPLRYLRKNTCACKYLLNLGIKMFSRFSRVNQNRTMWRPASTSDRHHWKIILKQTANLLLGFTHVSNPVGLSSLLVMGHHVIDSQFIFIVLLSSIILSPWLFKTKFWKNTIFMSVHPTGFFCRELPWSLTGFPHRHSANQPADRNPSLSLSSKYSQSSTADASQAQSQVISLPIFQLFPYRKVKPFTWFINSIQSTGNLSIWKAPHNGVGWPLEKTNVSDGQWGPAFPAGFLTPPLCTGPFTIR